MEPSLAQALQWRTRQQFSGLSARLRSAAVDTLVMAMAAVLALAAVGCASVALWLVLAPRIGPAGAALVLAAALMLTGAGIFVARHSRPWRSTATAPIPAEPAPDFADLAIQAMGTNKLTLLMAALIAGAAAAETQRGK